jgi:hypothetical protein
LLVGERRDFPALQDDHAHWRSFPQQWNAEIGANAGDAHRFHEGEFGIDLNVWDLDGASLENGPPCDVSAANLKRMILHELYHFG